MQKKNPQKLKKNQKNHFSVQCWNQRLEREKAKPPDHVGELYDGEGHREAGGGSAQP